MAKRGKIPIATIAGLAMTGARVLKVYMDNKDRPDIGEVMTYNLFGYAGKDFAVANAITPGFNAGNLISTWGPVIGGSAISKYVGGPKGLNVNAQIRSVPLFKL